MAPEGTDILKVPIARLYPSDDPAHYVSGTMSRYVYKYAQPRCKRLASLGSRNSESTHKQQSLTQASARCSGPAVEPQPLGELIVEILQKHVEGIHFREWNAGPMLDEHMTSPGFDISIYVHREVCGPASTEEVRISGRCRYRRGWSQEYRKLGPHQCSLGVCRLALSTVVASTTAGHGWTKWAAPRRRATRASLAPRATVQTLR